LRKEEPNERKNLDAEEDHVEQTVGQSSDVENDQDPHPLHGPHTSREGADLTRARSAKPWVRTETLGEDLTLARGKKKLKGNT